MGNAKQDIEDRENINHRTLTVAKMKELEYGDVPLEFGKDYDIVVRVSMKDRVLSDNQDGSFDVNYKFEPTMDVVAIQEVVYGAAAPKQTEQPQKEDELEVNLDEGEDGES